MQSKQPVVNEMNFCSSFCRWILVFHFIFWMKKFVLKQTKKKRRKNWSDDKTLDNERQFVFDVFAHWFFRCLPKCLAVGFAMRFDQEKLWKRVWDIRAHTRLHSKWIRTEIIKKKNQISSSWINRCVRLSACAMLTPNRSKIFFCLSFVCSVYSIITNERCTLIVKQQWKSALVQWMHKFHQKKPKVNKPIEP